MKKIAAISLVILAIFSSCKKDSGPETTAGTAPAPARLIFKFKFDTAQARLDGFGQPANTLPAGHQAQCPKFNGMGAHYLEMTQNDITAVGGGTVIYKAPVVTTGITTGTFTDAIDFSQERIKGEGEEFFSMPLSSVTPGSYKWLRMSVAYQNYDIKYKFTYGGNPYYFTGTIASFIGYSTYINSYNIKTQSVNVGTNKVQGYWGFETSVNVGGVTTTTTSVGQAPPGATTVVNPLFSTSPIPAGSCLVTGQFVNSSGSPQLLTITGHETSDIVITVSLSTNKSFEWVDHSSDAWFEPAAGDTVVDMGIRGMKPIITP